MEKTGKSICELHKFNLIGAFYNTVYGGRSLSGVLYVLCNIGNGITVLFLALGIGLNPGLQGRFLGLFTADYIKVLECKFLALPLLPAVGAAGVFVGILQLDGFIGNHFLPHDVLTDGAGIYADAVGGNHVLELRGRLETLGAAGIAHHHGVVAFLYALQGHLEALCGSHGNVVVVILCRHVVFIGIYAEHGEVAGVTGPHPVVRFTAEFTHGCRGSAHKADVLVRAVNNKIMDVVVVEAGNLCRAAGVGFLCFFLNCFGRFCPILNYLCHVFHAHEESDGKARAGDFLVQGLGPVAVHEVVVLIRGQALDAAVAAVMVGHKETLVRDHLSGAAAAKMHYGILEGGFIDRVDLLRGKFATCLAEVFSVKLFEEWEKPHSFIGHRRNAYGKGRDNSKNTFHLKSIYFHKFSVFCVLLWKQCRKWTKIRYFPGLERLHTPQKGTLPLPHLE